MFPYKKSSLVYGAYTNELATRRLRLWDASSPQAEVSYAQAKAHTHVRKDTLQDAQL